MESDCKILSGPFFIVRTRRLGLCRKELTVARFGSLQSDRSGEAQTPLCDLLGCSHSREAKNFLNHTRLLLGG